MNVTQHLLWKLRRTAAGLRQLDVASGVGISASKYSSFESGDREPTGLEAQLIEQFLPLLPAVGTGVRRSPRPRANGD
jgi:transcriptional regulator with XRE-family HTH domain